MFIIVIAQLNPRMCIQNSNFQSAPHVLFVTTFKLEFLELLRVNGLTNGGPKASDKPPSISVTRMLDENVISLKLAFSCLPH